MIKKIIISIIAAVMLIALGAIYYFSRRTTNQYCDYKINWEECDGEIIKINGNNPSASNGVMQHPIVTIPSDKPEYNLNQFQGYLDTQSRGQIILLSNEKIICPGNMTVIGKLKTKVGPCEQGSQTKQMYCGSSITVSQWQCN